MAGKWRVRTAVLVGLTSVLLCSWRAKAESPIGTPLPGSAAALLGPQQPGSGMERGYLLAGAAAVAGEPVAEATHDLERWGFAKENVRLFTTRDPRKVLADTQCFAAWNEEVVLLSFRGTRPGEALDWVTDLRVMKDAGRAWDGTRVHSGFSAALDSVWSLPSGGVFDVIREKAAAEEGRPARKVWITGHSLGGALALLASWRLANKGIPVAGVYVFGSPRVGDGAFATRYDQLIGKDNCQRFIYNRDLVPRLPPRALDWIPISALVKALQGYYPSYVDVGTVQYLGDPEWAYHSGKDAWRQRYGNAYRDLFVSSHWWERVTVPAERDRFLRDAAGPISDHFLAGYQEALWKKLTAAEQAEIPEFLRLTPVR